MLVTNCRFGSCNRVGSIVSTAPLVTAMMESWPIARWPRAPLMLRVAAPAASAFKNARRDRRRLMLPPQKCLGFTSNAFGEALQRVSLGRMVNCDRESAMKPNVIFSGEIVPLTKATIDHVDHAVQQESVLII